MTPLKKFDLTAKSAIVRSEKPNKGLDAIAAPNPNQMNRLSGFLPDGTKIMVAQRPGRGGMDFNKLLGGKVFAVAADALSPVYEKDKEGKPTKTQKVEEGLPLYSSSGFYLLSSKEYPSLQLFEAYTLLRSRGEQVWLLTQEQLNARSKQELAEEFDFDMLLAELETALDDANNLVRPFDADINKKRKRGIDRAKQDAEDADEAYTGVEFEERAVSKKDGNPFVLFNWQIDGEDVKGGAILREAEIVDDERDDGRTVMRYYSAAEAMGNFTRSATAHEIQNALRAGRTVTFSYVQGNVMRTSVSFRRKVENVLSDASKNQFGDAVYILAAMKGWTRGIISLMHSLHPNFPQADYDAQHYVAACRQAEVGLNKKDGGWTSPEGIHYSLSAALLH